jgi:hypothetical protein
MSLPREVFWVAALSFLAGYGTAFLVSALGNTLRVRRARAGHRRLIAAREALLRLPLEAGPFRFDRWKLANEYLDADRFDMVRALAGAEEAALDPRELLDGPAHVITLWHAEEPGAARAEEAGSYLVEFRCDACGGRAYGPRDLVAERDARCPETLGGVVLGGPIRYRVTCPQGHEIQGFQDFAVLVN